MIDSARQLAHFERMHDRYVEHYYDTWSMRYRHEFIFPLLWKDLDLNDKDVVEMACGSGQNSIAVLEEFPRARLRGYDISPSACADYRSNVGFPAEQADLTKPADFSHKCDAAFIIGGLHHCIADLEQTLKNAASMLKHDGVFIMLEPNAEFFLESIRKVWYRLDKSFDSETEHALEHDDLYRMASRYFETHDLTYFGGPGYFGILNSMILRVPISLKPVVSPPLMAAERLWNRIPGRQFHNVFLGRWVRNEVPVAF